MHQNSNVRNLDVAVLIWGKAESATRDVFVNGGLVGGKWL
jgi:hypothetical protein